MHYEIRGERIVGKLNDGDTIYVSNFKVFHEGRRVSSSVIRRKALTTKGYLKVRVLGIDTPEMHYPGVVRCNHGQRRRGIKIPPQAFGKEASEFTNKVLPEGVRVILETDEDRRANLFYDSHDRILAYVWTVKGNWKKDKMLNYELVNKGWAVPYQIWPNVRYFKQISRAAARQLQRKDNMYKFLRTQIIPFNELQNTSYLNEPFVYRRAIDGKLCAESPKSLMTRRVFDVRTGSIYPPQEYDKVPIPFRIFEDD